MKKTSQTYPWKFASVGGTVRVNIQSGEDIRHLGELDRKLWTVLSCPTQGLEFDEKTLKYIDVDADGKIRVDEVIKTAQWLTRVIKDADLLLEGRDVLEFSAFNEEDPDGARLLSSARQILKNLGQEKESVSVEDTADFTKIFAGTLFNGDGIITPASAGEDEALAKLIETIAGISSAIDRSGVPGITADHIEAFYAACADFKAWKEAGTKEVFPFGDKTPDALAAVEALKDKVADYFMRCKLIGFDEATSAALDVNVDKIAAIEGNLAAAQDQIGAQPLAKPSKDGKLKLDAVNPAWKAAVDAMKELVGAPKVLDEVSWNEILGKFGPYCAWIGAKKGGEVEGLGIECVEAILKEDKKAALLELIEKDKAEEANALSIEEVGKLVSLYKNFYRFLNNYVVLADFYDPEKKAIFQAGRLYIDQRSTDLCVKVAGPSPEISSLSGMYILYCACTSEKLGKSFNIAAVLTDGDVDGLREGKNAVFYDREGNDYTAKVIAIVDNPISVRQAFWSPYKKVARMINDRIDKKAAEKNEKSMAGLTAATNTAADGKAPAALAPPGYHWEFNDISGDFELVPDLGEYIQSTPPPDEDDLMQPVDISQVFPYDPEASEVAEPPAQRPRLAEPEPQLVLFPNVPAAVEPPAQRPRLAEPEPQPQPQPAPIPRAVIVQPPPAPAPAPPPAPPQPARRYNLRTREDRERAQTRVTLNRAPLNTHMIYTPLYTKLFEESDFPIMERRSNGRWYFSRLNYLRAIRYGGKLHDLYEKYTVEDGRALASIVDDHNTDGDKELKIPFDNVYNLKSSILFYIMDLISEDTEDRSYCALFSIDRRENQHRDRRRRGNQGVEYVLQTRLEAERGVEYNTIIALLLEILEKIWTDIGTTTRGQVIDTGIIWTRDTEMDSGDRLMIGDWVSTLNDPNKRSNLYIKLKFHLMNSAACSGHFSADVRKEVDEIFATGGVKVITNSDEMCLLYTILEGILMIEKVAGCSRGVVYETPEHVLAMSETYANESNQKIISELVLKKEVYKKIDENVGIRYSMNDFRRIMKEVEEELLGGSEYAIEIFLKVSKNEHVFPAYISERKSEKRIQIIGLSYGKINHFVLVVNPKSVWAMLGGKIFYTCSKCRKTFYTQSLLAKHECEEKSGEYHWSRQGCDDDVDPVVGVCPKCCLKFDNEFAYEFHQKHCFMKGKSGYKQVVLSEKQYMSADANQRMLMLELPKGHLYFADFESTISEEGDHTMMSFGLYGVNEQQFEIGYSMEEFMKAILRYSKENKKIKVYFHNAMNYDANFILREVISKPEYRDWSIQVIMKSSNRMQKLSFMYQDGKTKRIIEIGDTFFFLSMSLEKICGSIRSESLSKNKVNFKRFFEEIQKKYSVNDEDADRILKKNLFPYRFFNEPGKLDTSIEEFSKIFEPREENVAYFSESVNVDDLSKNYEEFKYVCEKYRCESARDYHDIYLLCDVMQIADVFLATRQEMWDSNQIDLTKYIGMPAASWAAFLKFDPTLELPLYRDTLYAEFFSGMTRGGVTSAPVRFAKSDANHTILYLDVNGLYPHVMRSYSYPCGNLRFIKVEPWDDAINEDPERWLRWKFDVLRSENKGMCVYVDLHEPDDVKKMTDLYPFAPEHRTIHDQYFDADGQLYPFLQKWSEANEGEKMKSFYGLVGTHYDKKEYGVNWLLLEWYMNHGLRVTKVHYWVEYDERDYMAPYIGDNIERRNRTTTEVGKKVHKDKSNAAYGKTFENPLNHEKFVIVRGGEKLEGLLQTANVSTINCIDEKTYVVKLLGERVELDRPTYIGANVTEYAKLHMYTLYYDKLCKMFPAVELVYTDTDSFIVRVEHPEGVDRTNLLSYMNRDEEIIGNLGGQLKSETGDDFIDEVIALRSKVYAYRTLSGHIGKRAKGTTAAAQKNELDWETYKRALITLKAVPTTNVQFKRERFTINSQHLLKISLSANDGKRYILEDGIHTHAFGY